jgi:L-threonylcarbamoyladenylate synthase
MTYLCTMDFVQDIEHCLRVLREGGIILYPTDTIWGIGCDATNPEAVTRIFNLKKRPEKKALIVLMADERDIIQYVSAPDPQVAEYLKTVHKPTTVVYKGMIHLAENLSEDGTIAIRLVEDAFCRQLIKRLRKPLVSTSANASGFKAPATFKEIGDEIKSGVDYIVKYRQDDQAIREPSSLIKPNPDGTVTVIRP